MPRAGLTRAAVVEEAARLSDEVGWDALTLAALAERVGVRQPSLYKHVAGLDALRREITVRSARELADVLGAAAVGRSGRDALDALCRAYRGWAHDHPGTYPSTLRAPDAADEELTSTADRVLAIIYAVLEGYGLTGDDAVDATRGLRALLHGFVSLEAAGGFGMPRDVDRSFAALVDAYDASLAGWGGLTPQAAGRRATSR